MSSAEASSMFVGVDGGGTKTAVTIVSSTGAVLASVTLGSSNKNSVGDEGASATIQSGIREALQQCQGDVSDIRSVVLSLSGCNSLADATHVETWLRTMFPSAVPASASMCQPPPITLVSAYNDSIAALVSGTEGMLDGLVLIAGTGMIAKGFAGAAREATAGGNGALIDGGSGYSIGINVLRAAFAAADGMGPPTPLLAASLNFLQLQRAEQIVDWLYADRSWDRVARLAPLAFHYGACEHNGETAPVDAPAYPTTDAEIDPVAARILDDAAEFLVRSARAVAKQLETPADASITVVCAGGILANAHMFGLVSRGIRAFLPNAKLVHPKVSPSEGAALLARSQWKAVEDAQQK